MLEDGAPLDSSEAMSWRSAANEEGIALAAVHDSDLLRPWYPLWEHHPVLIFPDGFRSSSPPMILERIRAQLEDAGTVLIASDAFSKDYPGGALNSLCEK